MILAIDATNIRDGGGVTHLTQLLKEFNPSVHHFSKIIVWACMNTLNQIENSKYIEKRNHPFLDKSIFFRLIWQRYYFRKELSKLKPEVIFVPGSVHFLKLGCVVTMSQNMLPFIKEERRRYAWTYTFFRLWLLEKQQAKSFVNSDGVIFLSSYARDFIQPYLKRKSPSSQIIAHGISQQFFAKVKEQKDISKYSCEDPFKILYVSTIDAYKHQVNLIPVICRLFNEGFPLRLTLVGGGHGAELGKLRKVILQHDRENKVVNYMGKVPYDKIGDTFHQADMFVFASSVENLPNILMQAMAAGLPICSSNKNPMPEVLADAGEYFDPIDQESMYGAIKKMLLDSSLRERYALKSSALAKQYSWAACANETFDYLSSFVNRDKS